MKAVSDRVVFGHMHEDHSLELSLVDRLPLKRALVIASGGDLAFALAGAKVTVTAVDSGLSGRFVRGISSTGGRPRPWGAGGC
jgi:regulator of RNase E activity RraA